MMTPCCTSSYFYGTWRVVQGEFAFTSPELRAKAEASWKHGLDYILAARRSKWMAKRTVWCQQHDAITLQPTSARKLRDALGQFQRGALPSFCFLMQFAEPRFKTWWLRVHAAAAWFKKTPIEGKAFRVVGTESRKLVDAPGRRTDLGPLLRCENRPADLWRPRQRASTMM